MKLSTIHIFGYGEAQIISDTLNFKAKVSSFTKLQAVIDDVKAKRPTKTVYTEPHVINIFADLRVDYNSTNKNACYKFDFKDLNVQKLNALVAEFQTLKNASV